MPNISFSEKAWEDYIYWQSQDKKTLKRINALLKDTLQYICGVFLFVAITSIPPFYLSFTNKSQKLGQPPRSDLVLLK